MDELIIEDWNFRSYQGDSELREYLTGVRERMSGGTENKDEQGQFGGTIDTNSVYIDEW